MQRLQSPFVLGLGGAMVGVVVILLGLHVWADHVLLHQAVVVMNQQLEQYPIKAKPPAASTPPAALVAPAGK